MEHPIRGWIRAALYATTTREHRPAKRGTEIGDASLATKSRITEAKWIADKSGPHSNSRSVMSPWGLTGEAMFQMINEAAAEPQDRKLTLLKLGAFLVALAVLGGAVYFFAFIPYANR